MFAKPSAADGSDASKKLSDFATNHHLKLNEDTELKQRWDAALEKCAAERAVPPCRRGREMLVLVVRCRGDCAADRDYSGGARSRR